MTIPKLLCLAISAALGLTPALYASHSPQKHIDVRQMSPTSFDQAHVRAQTGQFESTPRQALKPGPKPLVGSAPRSPEALSRLAAGLVVRGFPVVAPDASFSGFDGLDARDSRLVNRFTFEPPDQGLATDGKQVFEAINVAVQVFSTDGTPLTPPVGSYPFFGVSNKPNPDGSFIALSDPRVAFDWETKRWFVTVVEYTVTKTGGISGGSAVLVAVSKTSDAAGSYHVYSIDTSDTGFGACPCLGDQPLLGLNTDGLYLNTNEFSNTTGSFQTTLIIAISKLDLVFGSPTITAAGFDGLTLAEGLAYSVQPALTAPGTPTSQNNGTEFFASSLDFQNLGDNRVAVWALTNTESLESRVPNLNLLEKVIPVEQYGPPVPAVQKAGHFPLGQNLGFPEELLDSVDDRMQQTYFASGKLYCALSTLLFDPSGTSGPRTGTAWFAIAPDASFTALSAKIEHQGYIGIEDGSVLYPAFAVNSLGDGVIGFSLAGKNYFPSTGYVNFDNGAVAPLVHLAGIGQSPEDGFSGYPPFGSGVARWGDYSAAVVAPDGHLWFASEYIPNPFARPRGINANFGTFISKVE